MITPRKLVTPEDWEKLLQVMNSVHEKNRGISEEEVYQDVERAVTELRQYEIVSVSAFLTDGLAADLMAQCQEGVYLYTAGEILQEIRRVLLEKLTETCTPEAVELY